MLSILNQIEIDKSPPIGINPFWSILEDVPVTVRSTLSPAQISVADAVNAFS